MKYHIIKIISKILDALLFQKYLPGIPIIFYHGLGDQKSKLLVSVQAFEKQMKHLSQKAYRTILPNELKQSTPQDKVFVIAFDDALKSVYEYAFPILKKYGFKAVVFIATDYIGKQTSYARDKKNRQFELLTTNDILALQKSGWYIGNHFASHQNLTTLSKDVIQNEYQKAQSILKNISTNTHTDVVAYPFNRYDNEVLETLRSVDVHMGFNGGNRLYTQKEDILAIPRIEIDMNYSRFIAQFSPMFHRIKMKLQPHV